ncbi:MAG: hypothetical protein PF570_08900, partial [Candidatus Cloacimonetes bacterium]|nr:hypothetical protein [Candidatus Cloacimonadota bacterium]
MRKKILTILMVLAFANFMFTALAFAQEEIAEEGTAVEDIVAEEAVEEVPFEETSQSGGLEMFARKIVGSGLVDLFIQGGFVMYPMLLLLIGGIATILWKIMTLSYSTCNNDG